MFPLCSTNSRQKINKTNTYIYIYLLGIYIYICWGPLLPAKSSTFAGCSTQAWVFRPAGRSLRAWVPDLRSPPVVNPKLASKKKTRQHSFCCKKDKKRRAGFHTKISLLFFPFGRGQRVKLRALFRSGNPLETGELQARDIGRWPKPGGHFIHLTLPELDRDTVFTLHFAKGC